MTSAPKPPAPPRMRTIDALRSEVEDMLGLVVEDPPSLKIVQRDDLERIARWAAIVHLEASDNPVRARAAPKILRDLLPQDHYLQTWRLSKPRRPRGRGKVKR